VGILRNELNVGRHTRTAEKLCDNTLDQILTGTEYNNLGRPVIVGELFNYGRGWTMRKNRFRAMDTGEDEVMPCARCFSTFSTPIRALMAKMLIK
jgi:hypothetical protein